MVNQINFVRDYFSVIVRFFFSLLRNSDNYSSNVGVYAMYSRIFYFHIVVDRVVEADHPHFPAPSSFPPEKVDFISSFSRISRFYLRNGVERNEI